MKKARIVFLILAVFWMGVIFTFSAQSASESREMSGGIVRLVQNVFYSEWESVPEAEYESHMHALSYFIRKAAHFFEFLILGFLVAGFFFTFRKSTLFTFLAPLLFGIVYAVSDEIHQLFSEARAMQFFDVLIDSSGVFFGVLIAVGILFYIMTQKEQTKMTQKEQTKISCNS